MDRTVALKNFIFTLLIAGSGMARGQALHNQSKITVTRNTILTVKGSVENRGIIENNGQLKVAGSWLNSGAYMPASGAIDFNGTSGSPAQRIDNNGMDIRDIVISGGSRKIIQSDITVTGGIVLEDGIVESENNSRFIFNPGAAIFGGSDQAHIHAAVYQRGEGDKLFPIGNGTLYLPVELLAVEGKEALAGVQVIESENVALSRPVSLDAISDKRYWHVDMVAGEFKNSQIVLPLRDESFSLDPEVIVVAQSLAPTENFSSIGKSLFEGAISNGRVTSDKMVTLPFVTLASTARETAIIVYNAVSANGDGKNDFLRIGNIENHPQNKFMLFSRWGDKIFEVANYDNQQNIFKGRSNIQGDHELVSGTYYYVLELEDGPPLRGFLSIKN
jgi:gliding motility-associated-like protein